MGLVLPDIKNDIHYKGAVIKEFSSREETNKQKMYNENPKIYYNMSKILKYSKGAILRKDFSIKTSRT